MKRGDQLENNKVEKILREYQESFGSVERQVGLQAELDIALEEFETIGEKINALKTTYDVVVAKKYKELLEKKLQISVLKVVVSGEEDVSQIREVISNLEHRKEFLTENINRLKLEIRINEAQIAREWSQSK